MVSRIRRYEEEASFPPNNHQKAASESFVEFVLSAVCNELSRADFSVSEFMHKLFLFVLVFHFPW